MKILLVSGSLRRDSFNTQLAQDALKALETSCEVRLLDYRDVPLFDQDDEIPMKSVISRVRGEFEWAEGIWFFTPEYNGAVPGVLKNLLDWMSRASIPGKMTSSALYGRFACISGAAGRRAAALSREQLAVILKACGMKVCPDSRGFALLPAEMKSNAFSDPDQIAADIAAQASEFISWMKSQTVQDQA